MQNIKVKAMRISSYITLQLIQLSGHRRSQQFQFIEAMDQGDSSKPTLSYVPNTNANKIAWH